MSAATLDAKAARLFEAHERAWRGGRNGSPSTARAWTAIDETEKKCWRVLAALPVQR